MEMERGSSLTARALWAICALGLFASSAWATPITYELSGFASGSIGGSAFTNALVRVTLTGDTDDVVSLFGIAWANEGTTTVNIAGIGTALVTDSTAIYSAPPGTYLPDLTVVLIGTLDHPPALDSSTGIAAIGSDALLGYDLRTSFGPLTAIPGGVGYPTDVFVHTTLGPLSFTSNIVLTTAGTFTATTVPEPSTILLLGAGLIAARRRSRRRSRA